MYNTLSNEDCCSSCISLVNNTTIRIIYMIIPKLETVRRFQISLLKTKDAGLNILGQEEEFILISSETPAVPLNDIIHVSLRSDRVKV